jgi:hypothetical protein
MMFRAYLQINHRPNGSGRLSFQEEEGDLPPGAYVTAVGRRSDWKASPDGNDIVTYAGWFENRSQAVSAVEDLVRSLGFRSEIGWPSAVAFKLDLIRREFP